MGLNVGVDVGGVAQLTTGTLCCLANPAAIDSIVCFSHGTSTRTIDVGPLHPGLPCHHVS